MQTLRMLLGWRHGTQGEGMEPTKALFSLRGSAADLRLCLSQMHIVNTGLLMRAGRQADR